MKNLSRKNILYEFDKMREKCRARDFGYIFSNPLIPFLFILMVLRAITIRLVPHKTSMYFIRQHFKNLYNVATGNGYCFKIYNRCSKEIVQFVDSRNQEDNDFVRKVYLKHLEDRFQNGIRACALLNQQNNIISLFFTSNQHAWVQQVHYDFKPEAKEIMITDIYTLKNFRRKGLYLILLDYAKHYFNNEGYDTFVMWIMKHNRATIMAQLKAGFTDSFQTVSLFTWLGLKKIFVHNDVVPLEEL